MTKTQVSQSVCSFLERLLPAVNDHLPYNYFNREISDFLTISMIFSSMFLREENIGTFLVSAICGKHEIIKGLR